jgi:nucleoside-diphosphate-sugar epimerase
LARHPTIDTSRLRQEFGWVPRYSIEETVTEYVEWLRANPDGWTFDPDDAPWA